MKILILANKLPYPPRDGGSIATLNMITGLRDSGNELTCMALNTIKHSFPVEMIPPGLSRTIRFSGIVCDTSIRPLRLLLNFLFSRKPYIAERFNVAEFRNRLSQLLSEEQFDVIQMEGPYLGHYTDVIRAGSQALLSYRAHNAEYVIWKRKAENEQSRIRRWYFRNMASRLERFEKELVGKADCVVAISQTDESILKGLGYVNPMITIPAGLSLQSYSITPLPSGPSLFFIGALDWLPNQEGLRWFISEVLDRLATELPDVRLHVAGRNAPDRMKKEFGHPRITYHGEVEDARDFIRMHRVMIAPLFTGSGIRIKILEAMAMGRPVVTTPIGIEGIPARNSREVMIADNPDLFKDQVIRLIREDRAAQEMADRGRRLIHENFDTFRLSTRLSQFFKEQV